MDGEELVETHGHLSVIQYLKEQCDLQVSSKSGVAPSDHLSPFFLLILPAISPFLLPYPVSRANGSASPQRTWSLPMRTKSGSGRLPWRTKSGFFSQRSWKPSGRTEQPNCHFFLLSFIRLSKSMPGTAAKMCLICKIESNPNLFSIHPRRRSSSDFGPLSNVKPNSPLDNVS